MQLTETLRKGLYFRKDHLIRLNLHGYCIKRERVVFEVGI